MMHPHADQVMDVKWYRGPRMAIVNLLCDIAEAWMSNVKDTHKTSTSFCKFSTIL
jgi:hypothetical protein